MLNPRESTDWKAETPWIVFRKTTPPKNIQITAPKEKDRKSLVPQVSHGLEKGDPSGKSYKPDPFKEKIKGIKVNYGI